MCPADGYAPCLVAHPDLLSEDPEICRAFLQASAQGWALAAEDPDSAAEDLVRLAEADSGISLDLNMVRKSAAFVAPRALDKSGKWGGMDPAVWTNYLAWLDKVGLLTTGLPSRNPDGDITMSLDQLRSGGGGQPIPLDSVEPVFTNDFLP